MARVFAVMAQIFISCWRDRGTNLISGREIVSVAESW
jgi:hypothetical protein